MALPGYEVGVDAAPYELRPYGLAVDLFDPLDAPGLVDDNGALRWLNGVKIDSLGCVTGLQTTRAGDMCTGSVQYAAATESADLPDWTSFYAFRMVHALAFTTICGLTVEDAQTKVRTIFEMASSAMIARQVLAATFEPANPSLVGEADNVTTSDATPLGALAAVEDALAQKLLNARGLIHVSPAMLTRLKAGGMVTLVNGQYETATGHRVVADAGYAGFVPNAGEARVIGSGPVRYRSTEIMPVGQAWENFDLKRNVNTVRFEQYALVVFEKCPVMSATATVATVPDLAGGL